MVGKEAKVIAFAERWVGAPFKLGVVDCMQMFGMLYDLPEEYEGVNWKRGDYIPIYTHRKQQALKLLDEFIEQEFHEVPRSQLKVGDLIMIDTPAYSTRGVYLGGNMYMGVDERRGVYIARLFTDEYRVMRRNGWET